jgi:lipoate-protein ligase B
MSSPCLRVDLGRRDYREIWELQHALVKARQAGQIPDLLLFVEHPPTYTLGRGGKREHLLISEEELPRLGASLVETDRGGDITYHGPGQIVGYPIVDLKQIEPDVHQYLRRLEEVLIRSLAGFGLATHRSEGFTGVWHREGKIAAMGVRISRWVTSHGFALNVSTDLAYFNHIVPCGIVDRRVTSMEAILRKPVILSSVKDVIAAEFGRLFGRGMLAFSEKALFQDSYVQVG